MIVRPCIARVVGLFCFSRAKNLNPALAFSNWERSEQRTTNQLSENISIIGVSGCGTNRALFKRAPGHMVHANYLVNRTPLLRL